MRSGRNEVPRGMKGLFLLISTAWLLTVVSPGQTPAPAPAAPAAAKPVPVPLTDQDLKSVDTPKPEVRAKGDPDGALTGTVSDIVVSDTKKGLTVADVVNQIGQNRIAINFVWTLVTGFLVMFMQAGFAIVETGLCRAKNANHTMMMNFMVYGVGIDRKSTRLNSSHLVISYAVFCLKKKKHHTTNDPA